MTRANKTFSRIQKSVDMVRYFGKTSAPYLSQDSFKRIADLDFDTKRPIGAKEVDSARVIFCNSGNVENFLELYGKKIRAKVLIFGNNDVDFLDFPYSIPSSVRAIYLQNSQISDGFFRTLPIGIENIEYAQNGLPHLLRSSFHSQEKKGRFLAGPFANSHEERRHLIHLIKQQEGGSLIDLETGRVEPRKYARLASAYQLILCPRGNGLDTHRFWESLYRGSLPVVIKSPWSQSIASLGIPVVEIDNWGSIFTDSDTIISDPKCFNPSSIDALWENYWYQELLNLQK